MDQQGVSPIGKQVARYRKAAKMSGEELAEKAGVGLTRSVIANLENGRKDDVTVTQLMALAKALHVPPVLLIADIFDPGAESPYPLPDFEPMSFDSKHRALVSTPSVDNNSSLLAWIGAYSFRTRYPVENPATKMAYDAYASVNFYLSALTALRASAARYASAVEGDDRDLEAHTEGMLQHDANVVFSAIDSLRRSDVKVSDDIEARVHTLLSDLGLTYRPPHVGDTYDIPDFDG